MKCLTLQEPWAWLVVDLARYDPALAKDVENRGAAFPRYCGPLLIHSGKGRNYGTRPIDEWLGMVDQPWPAGVPRVSFDSICGRGIVGVVNVVATVSVDSIAEIARYQRWAGSPWAEGPRCLLIDRVLPFEHPIRYRGQQGIFNVPNDLVRDSIEEAKERCAIQQESRAAGIL